MKQIYCFPIPLISLALHQNVTQVGSVNAAKCEGFEKVLQKFWEN